MPRPNYILKLFFATLLCFLFASESNVFASERIKDELLKKGIYQFRQENYDEALETFKLASEKQPQSSLTAYYLGLTYKRLENYIEAKEPLKKSLTMKPKIVGALIETIDLYYRLGEFDEAKKWIKVAEDEGVRPAQSKFLKGLTLQKNGEYKESIKAFKDAKDLDERLTQSADYQIGVCFLKMENFVAAKDTFQQASIIDPYSDIAGYANRYIDALERKLEKERPFHFTARTAFEYDSNVLLQPTESAFITDIADKDDTRQVYDLKGDYTIRTKDNSLSLKTGYGFHASKQNDFGSYDIVGNNVFMQSNVSFKNLLATFPVGYSHTIVNDKNYLGTFNAGNINNFKWLCCIKNPAQRF